MHGETEAQRDSWAKVLRCTCAILAFLDSHLEVTSFLLFGAHCEAVSSRLEMIVIVLNDSCCDAYAPSDVHTIVPISTPP